MDRGHRVERGVKVIMVLVTTGGRVSEDMKSRGCDEGSGKL